MLSLNKLSTRWQILSLDLASSSDEIKEESTASEDPGKERTPSPPLKANGLRIKFNSKGLLVKFDWRRARCKRVFNTQGGLRQHTAKGCFWRCAEPNCTRKPLSKESLENVQFTQPRKIPLLVKTQARSAPQALPWKPMVWGSKLATEGTRSPLHPLRLTFLSILIQSHYLMISSLVPVPHHVEDLSSKWNCLWENSFPLVQRVMPNKCFSSSKPICSSPGQGEPMAMTSPSQPITFQPPLPTSAPSPPPGRQLVLKSKEGHR